MASILGESINKLISSKVITPFILKWKETKINPTQKEAKEITYLKETRSSKRQKRLPASMKNDFLWTKD
jgi:hypothetical protein